MKAYLKQAIRSLVAKNIKYLADETYFQYT